MKIIYPILQVMKAVVLQEDIQKPLSTISRFASPKAQLPILGNILIRVKKNKITLNATNLELSISYSLGARVIDEGEVTVPAKALSDIVSNLQKGQVTIEAKQEIMQITSESFSGKLAGMNTSDFPPVSEAVGEGSIELDFDILRDSLSKVLFAASLDEARAVLTGVLFMFDDGELDLVATDGFRLSQVKNKMKNVKKGDRVIVPKNFLTEATRLFSEKTIKIKFDKKNGQVIAGGSGYVFASRLIDGEFPPFEKIIPKDSPFSVGVGGEDLLRNIKIAAVYARDGANVIKFGFSDDKLNIISESKSLGGQTASLDVKTDGSFEGDKIAFNFKFLEDVLGVVEGESLDIALKDPDSPGVFTDPKNPNFLHLIMPVKITE